MACGGEARRCGTLRKTLLSHYWIRDVANKGDGGPNEPTKGVGLNIQPALADAVFQIRTWNKYTNNNFTGRHC